MQVQKCSFIQIVTSLCPFGFNRLRNTCSDVLLRPVEVLVSDRATSGIQKGVVAGAGRLREWALVSDHALKPIEACRLREL